MMLDGISEIEFIPPDYRKKNVIERLRELMNSSLNFQAAIAFWSISPDKLFPPIFSNIYRVLEKEDSFVCVDLQKPTNIDHLALLESRGSNIYLNTTRLQRNKESTSSSPALLHTKLILADKDNGDAELWIGSHNWTECALFGPNLEATMIIRLSRGSTLYSQTKSNLKKIRDICEEFDIEQIDNYKLWQNYESREQNCKYVIDLEGQNISNLKGQSIIIFGTENDDYNAVKTVKDKILVSIYNSDIESERYLYEARISQTGELISADPATIEFEIKNEQRFAFKRGYRFPVLNKPQVIETKVLNQALFFVTLIIEKLEANKFILKDPIPKQTFWIDLNDSRERTEYIELKTAFFDPTSVMVPQNPDHILKTGSREMTLIEKRTDESQKLVVKKCIEIIK